LEWGKSGEEHTEELLIQGVKFWKLSSMYLWVLTLVVLLSSSSIHFTNVCTVRYVVFTFIRAMKVEYHSLILQVQISVLITQSYFSSIEVSSQRHLITFNRRTFTLQKCIQGFRGSVYKTRSKHLLLNPNNL
jgi:hypothetical protein